MRLRLWLPLAALLIWGHAGALAAAAAAINEVTVATAQGRHAFTVELAATPDSRRQGLMHRRELALDAGMLFIFETPGPLSFWMKNTRVPLSIAFIDDLGKVLQIEDMRPFDETSVPSRFIVRYALEVEKGWYRKAGLKVGDSLPEFDRKVNPYKKLAK